jgi:single-strand DNA-binding protein
MYQYFLTHIVMRSFNRVMFMGHLAADVNLRQTKNGTHVANFPLAINRMIRGENGAKRETVDFHRVVVWGALADVCNKYLGKGLAVYVEGRLINRSFEDKEGNMHYRTEVVAENVNFLTWKKSKAGESLVVESVAGNDDLGEEAEGVTEAEKELAGVAA